ncbi:uncharacterized protein LOC126426520 [Schistocerca serialis cubense]|uniref:uncharacterized protein LOC126426520 n=1 Tax=Schistocerca serialis cubense TaxID=2023355 RepID=UPI00214F45E9|nr:uncharacterized protein LOC126426520 [Schistocerca serialis cubense]
MIAMFSRQRIELTSVGDAEQQGSTHQLCGSRKKKFSRKIPKIPKDLLVAARFTERIKKEPEVQIGMALVVNYVLGDPSAVSECANKIKEEAKGKGEQDRAEATVAPFAEDFVLEQDPLNIKKEEDLEDTSLSNLEVTNSTKQEAEVTFDGDGAENCNLEDTSTILEHTNDIKQEAEITIDEDEVQDYVLEDLLPVSEWTNNIKNEPELTIDKDEMKNNDLGRPSSSEWTYNIKDETEAALEVDRVEDNDMVSTEYASNTTWSSQIMEKFPSTSRGNVLQKLIHEKTMHLRFLFQSCNEQGNLACLNSLYWHSGGVRSIHHRAIPTWVFRAFIK